MKKRWIMQATGYNHPTDQMEADWETFTAKVADYDTLLAEQIEQLKGLVESRTRELEEEVGKYEAKTATIHVPNKR